MVDSTYRVVCGLLCLSGWLVGQSVGALGHVPVILEDGCVLLSVVYSCTVRSCLDCVVHPTCYGGGLRHSTVVHFEHLGILFRKGNHNC